MAWEEFGGRAAFVSANVTSGIRISAAADRLLGGAERVRLFVDADAGVIALKPAEEGAGRRVTRGDYGASVSCRALIDAAGMEPGRRYPARWDGGMLVITVGPWTKEVHA